MRERDPVDPVLDALRDWGIRALDAILDGTAIPALAADTLVGLRPWLAAAPVARPDRMMLRQMATVFRYRGVPADLSPLQQRTLGAALAGPEAEVRDFPQPLADRLLEALGALAWSDPVLRLHAASRIRAHLRVRILFDPRTLPVVSPPPPLFWCLLACPLRRSWRRRGLWRVDTLFREAAERLALRPGWAGFWEQWMLALWLSRRRDGQTLPAGLARGLAGLPLFREPEAASMAEALRTRAGIAAREDIEVSALTDVSGRPTAPAGFDWQALLGPGPAPAERMGSAPA